MIQVSHEMPLCLLEDGTERRVNDYFYALVHLFDTHPDYYRYTVDQLKSGREVILDNSAYELHGQPFDTGEFTAWIKNLEQDSDGAASRKLTYIIPDEFDEMEATFERAAKFLEDFDMPGQAMVVCQGKNIFDLLKIYTAYTTKLRRVRKIGINFMSQAYTTFVKNAYEFPPDDPWVARSMGRKYFMETLYHSGKLVSKNIHLLGSSLPSEFRYYTKEHPKLSEFIYSLDTSAPVIQGIFSNNTYDVKNELTHVKMSQKLAENLDIHLSEPQRLRVIHNSELFRIYNGV